MQIITDALVGYFLFVPIYLVLAAYSLRYYATFPNISEHSIDSFLWSIGWPLRGFYAEYSGHNLFTNDRNISLSTYIKSESHTMNTVRRVYVSVAAVATIFAFTVSFTRQTEAIWQIEHIILISAHILSAFWAWRFGSKLLQIEKSLH